MGTLKTSYKAKVKSPIFAQIHEDLIEKLVKSGDVVLPKCKDGKDFKPGCICIALTCAVDKEIASTIRALIPQSAHGRFAEQEGDAKELRKYLESFKNPDWTKKVLDEEIAYLFNNR